MARSIAIMSGKGGVGKSSISLLVAKVLALHGRTILIDFDICGPSVATGLNLNGKLIKTANGFQPIKASENLDALSFGTVLNESDAVIWRGPKKLAFLELFYKSAQDYEYIVYDTPPGISEEHQFFVDKAIEAIIVTTPQNLALNDAQRCIEYCQSKDIQIIGLIENMAKIKCDCCEKLLYPFGSKGGMQLANEYNLRYLCSLPLEPELSESIDTGDFNTEFMRFETFSIIKEVLENENIIRYDVRQYTL